MFQTKKAFTLVELIVATLISSIVLVFVFTFISDTTLKLGRSNNSALFISTLGEFILKMNNYRNVYVSGALIDSGTGHDLIIMRDDTDTSGVVIGIVDSNTMLLESTGSYDIYKDKFLGFRDLSSDELADIDGDLSLIYGYKFLNDKVYPDLKMKDFQVESYNSGAIFDIKMDAIFNYTVGNQGKKFSDIGNQDIVKYTLNF